MKVINIEQGSQEWHDFRKGKISGTMLSELYSPRGTRKIGFYELIADQIAVEPDGENVMDRGLRLEQEAIDLLSKELKIEFDRPGIWQHSKYPKVIISPDASAKNDLTIAAEIKCLNSARHLQAIIENKVPKEYEAQKLQYFIVNENLQTLYFTFYDPRVVSRPLHIIKVTREELGNLPEKYLKFQLGQLEEVDIWIEELTF